MTADSQQSLGVVSMSSSAQNVTGSPNEAALLALMEKTGYAMIQENGQRKYGPPPDWGADRPPPPRGCEIFVGKIPRDCYEDELVPVFEGVGSIYEFRLMMDFSGSNRGYGFVMYTCRADARRAVKQLNNYEIRKGRLLGVCVSVDNCRLFVGGIPKTKQREEIMSEMVKVTEGVVDVIVYPSASDKSKNRGFAFVEYESHRSAAMARRRLIPGRIQLWGHQIAVDWAEPEQDVDEEIMATVKILYVRNLMLTTTEDTLRKVFSEATKKENSVERVKKIRDFAFVHFAYRKDAILAMQELNGTALEGTTIEVVLAKPVNDYVRYTRTGRSTFAQPFHYETTAFSNPVFYGPLATPTTRLVSDQNVRNTFRNRGRGAAGSRNAGCRGFASSAVNYVRGNLQRQSVEGQLYELLPGMELTPTNPVTLKPQSLKSPVQILEEFCQKNNWGIPIYQLHSALTRDGSGDIQLFLYKVTIPGFATQYPGSNLFQPNKLCRTVDEAKTYAAEYVLTHLGVSFESSSEMPVFALATSPSPYQGRPLTPAAFSMANSARSDLSYPPSVPLLTTGATSYMVAASTAAKLPPPQMRGDYAACYDYPQAVFPNQSAMESYQY